MRRGPRWWHHLRAAVGGYFWLPCPVCGRPFGGHEWTDEAAHIFAPLGRRRVGALGVCSVGCRERWEREHPYPPESPFPYWSPTLGITVTGDLERDLTALRGVRR